VTALAEAWLLAFVLAATFGAGALAVRAIGILLQERWSEPLSPLLVGIGRAMPVLLLMAVPLVLLAGRLYPWAGGPGAFRFLAAGGVILVLWCVLGRLLARPEPSRRLAGLALLPLVLSAAIGFEDWALSRDEGWTGSLNGLSMLVGGAVGMLGLAVLAQGCPTDREARTGVERALLTFGIAALWFVFVPFVTVWAADLPGEAAWYLRRGEGIWAVVKMGIALPALAGAVALGVVPQWAPWRMRAVCALMVLHHVALVLWTVRPDAPLAPGAASGAPSVLADAIVIAAILLLALAAVRWAGRRSAEPV